MLAYLPYLFFLACPVGMGLMMWVLMRAMRQPQAQTPPMNPVERDSALDAPPLGGRTRNEQIAELRARLEDSQAQQEALARELARQERAERHHLAETERRG